MPRSKTKPTPQPNEFTCGPASLKTALDIVGIKKSLSSLTKLCKTSHDGTTNHNLAQAAVKSGACALIIENATLKHLIHSLQWSHSHRRALIVNYIYRQTKNQTLHEDSGHLSVVSSYSQTNHKIYLLDPYSSQKKSYFWPNFLARWYDVDLDPVSNRKKYHIRPLIIIAKNQAGLPKFKTENQKLYL